MSSVKVTNCVMGGQKLTRVRLAREVQRRLECTVVGPTSDGEWDNVTALENLEGALMDVLKDTRKLLREAGRERWLQWARAVRSSAKDSPATVSLTPEQVVDLIRNLERP